MATIMRRFWKFERGMRVAKLEENHSSTSNTHVHTNHTDLFNFLVKSRILGSLYPYILLSWNNFHFHFHCISTSPYLHVLTYIPLQAPVPSSVRQMVNTKRVLAVVTRDGRALSAQYDTMNARLVLSLHDVVEIKEGSRWHWRGRRICTNVAISLKCNNIRDSRSKRLKLSHLKNFHFE